jgi:polar amino acid transport system permease protein
VSFDPAFAIAAIPMILRSAGATIFVAIAASLGACALGFIAEMVRRGGRRRHLTMRFMIDTLRSTPILAQLYFWYFVLPHYGITLPALAVGILGLSIYYAGYISEVFRAGIDAIPSGQGDAARALGLKRWQAVMLIIAPQMLRNIAAPLGNYFVSIVKTTPYLAVLAVPEMLGTALDIASDTFRYAEPILIVGVGFLVLSVAISRLVSVLERRLLAPMQRSRR